MISPSVGGSMNENTDLFCYCIEKTLVVHMNTAYGKGRILNASL